MRFRLAALGAQYERVVRHNDSLVTISLPPAPLYQINADENGRAEFEARLAALSRKKEEHLKRLNENREFAKTFDRDIG